MALNFRNRLLLAKVENTYADSALTFAGTDAMLVSNLDVTPLDGTMIDRELVLPFLGNRQKITGQRLFRLSFDVELTVGTGLGVAPKWGKLLVACGFSQTVVATTSVTYAPVTKPGANDSSVAFDVNVDGNRHIGRGGRGTATFVLEAGELPRISFEFTCQYVAPTAAAATTPDFTGYDPDPIIVNSQNTTAVKIGDFVACMQSFNLAMNNVLPARQLAGCTEQVIFTGREPNGEMVVESPLIGANGASANDFFADSVAQTKRKFEWRHNATDTQSIYFDMPTCSIENPTYSESDEIVMINLPIYPQPTVAGNDEIKLEIKAPPAP
jgi:hypothetical protein